MRLSKMPYLFILFVSLQINLSAFPQNSFFPIDKWIKNLDAEDDTLESKFNEIAGVLTKMDSTFVFKTLNDLEKKGASAGNFFQVRIKYLRATMLWKIWEDAAKDTIVQLMKPALQQAYEINDDYLIANLSWWYGKTMYLCKEIEPATTYCLNSVEIIDKRGATNKPAKYQFLGELLYATRDFDKSIYYLKRAIENEKDTSHDSRIATISRWNTIALCWQRTGNYDSAFHYYDIALQNAIAANSEVWKGIISGNKGIIYFLQKKYYIGKPMLEYDYRISMQYGEIPNAANALQWIARINLLQGNKDSALLQARQAMQMLNQQPQITTNYFQSLYYAMADIHRALGNNDSFYYYSELYNHLHDSTERAIANSSLKISRLRLDNQANVYKIRELQKEKDAEARERNLIVAAIIAVDVFASLLLNRQRLKLKYRQQLALQQKLIAEKEVAAAKEQLSMFTQNIIEKTKLIETLEQQVAIKPLTDEQQQLASELTNQTILTEEDWEKFKALFERIYPGFFLKLKETAPDITVAEQRIAAITRLHLNTKQMASMLGISSDSVYKIKQRLRKRLQLNDNITMETYLTKIQ